MSQAINAGIATSNQLSQAVSATKGDDLGKSDFLLLLVTQFQHQDPLNPMDDKEFVAQLAQFSSLEQLMNINTGMEGLTTATQAQQMINATSYIGKEVLAGGNSIVKREDGSTSELRWAIGEDMTKGTLYVYDQNMNQIYGASLGARTAGEDIFQWNGKNYLGAEAPKGVYYVRLACENANGETIMVDTAVAGRVKGIATDQGTTYLGLEDGRTVPLANVREVLDASAAKNTSTDSDTSSNTDSGTNTDSGSASSDGAASTDDKTNTGTNAGTGTGA